MKDGITSFVKRLRAHPLLAVACGFEPDSVPGVCTFYDFLDRFWLLRRAIEGPAGTMLTHGSIYDTMPLRWVNKSNVSI